MCATELLFTLGPVTEQHELRRLAMQNHFCSTFHTSGIPLCNYALQSKIKHKKQTTETIQANQKNNKIGLPA